MCGINGIVYFDPGRPVDPGVLKKMSDAIVHRGPDDEGAFIRENAGLGFRRLSIIDLSTGHQPLSNEEGTTWIVFNGEIYNYLELRDGLKARGCHFRTTSDTEVIVHLYDLYGEDCVRHLRGMFALAILDLRKGRLFLARDRFGIKPLYYYTDHDRLVFASEIKSILQCPGIDRTLSEEALESYFSFGYITSDLSVFRRIRKLPAAHTLTLNIREPSPIPEPRRYWELPLQPDPGKTAGEWKEAVRAALQESVRMHMVSDVPLGAFLSGGIDSSSVVAMMSRAADRPVKTFSIGFAEQEFNELAYAREIAEKYHTEHHELILEPASVDLLPLLAESYDEPFADSSAIPTYFVSRFAREYVTVALSGDGGDELFAGYSAYSKFMAVRAKNPLPDVLNPLVFGTAERAWPEKWPGKGMLYYLSRKKDHLGAYYCLWKEQERKKLYRQGLREKISTPGEKIKLAMLEERKIPDFLTGLQYLDVRSYMVDDILTKVDRVSMQNSLEVRVPLLDHVFAELAFSIPSELKLKDGHKKHIFKQSVEDLLTPGVMAHRKQGFGVPITVWFRKDLKTYMQDVLLDPSQPMFGYLDPAYVKKQAHHHLAGLRDMSSKIWSLLFFNEWLKKYG